METIFFDLIKELKRTKIELEKKLNVSISIIGKKAVIDGEPLDVYEANLVLQAMNFGFSAKKALALKEEDMLFKIIHIKQHTNRKNMKDIKARLIGTLGKTKKTIEEISESYIIIIKNEIGIISPAENVDNVTTAIISIIKGSKQSNIYNFLERMNRVKKINESLGIIEQKEPKPKDKESAKKKKNKEELQSP